MAYGPAFTAVVQGGGASSCHVNPVERQAAHRLIEPSPIDMRRVLRSVAERPVTSERCVVNGTVKQNKRSIWVWLK